MASNAARNVMQAIARHSAKSAMAGDGNSVHIKNFAYANSGPRPTLMQVTVDEDVHSQPREYFLRPKFDMRMHKTCRLGYLPGHFKSYAFEDTPHMHGLLSFLVKMNIDPDHLCHLPADMMHCEYELVLHRVYPLLFCGPTSREQAGSIVIHEKMAEIAVADSGGGLEKVEILAKDITIELARHRAFVYALVHRRNALVFDPDRGYGIIVPTAPGQYLDPEDLGYLVEWVDGSRDMVAYLDLDDLLIALGAHLFVNLRCSAIADLVSEISLPEGKTIDDVVFRCSLFYPNGEHGNEEDFTKVYVNVPYCRRQNGVLQKGMSEVYKVALSDLVSPARLRESNFEKMDTLWIGV